jgi:hypothetical protein
MPMQQGDHVGRPCVERGILVKENRTPQHRVRPRKLRPHLVGSAVLDEDDSLPAALRGGHPHPDRLGVAVAQHSVETMVKSDDSPGHDDIRRKDIARCSGFGAARRVCNSPRHEPDTMK